ncbi:MAG: hypothetical protein A3C02_00045 [Candidatus Andersenbacteria bacterium RIFCSPHIGHO2_02_FULL_45_11]|uniref:UDP-N-acetylmuramate--L-alanine ligase n=1 Tax=Candidatus Andersenbacteria bacterium RIFCSPHIGHO2_12_FULL_45_11 TaxID=1797281 RepID=A0A1G1X498_9BACT|nr:MAG: hypothetical protein A2805_02010 [Candidatus Andersenbacteria bacterium RIFCSPHIGHO2_01_FULL_46_36]OGY31948.1 MAG: hypothetical protein A3C02_00045 [Candidatus Andersenbacteria bacterium RIFCSPHIGHO2_02_FULL_45_11]OGY34157.1 MAG: hypothetical protein A3D99_00355 [Candidatus Andersenbacteria bacterium RIFCSPHIGHO2_12_FULL_45_11]QBM02275.1 UDP-N-acetylmuramate--L-alanine ligase [uncultured archaeon]
MRTSLFLGIGGSGMRGLAYLLEQKGETIIGYDDNSHNTKCSLEEAASALTTSDRVIYSDAVPEDHALRMQARKHSVREASYQQALGEFSANYTTIAITGTHGKSSTTAFLAHIAIENDIDPTVLVGANMPTLPGEHARVGTSKYFIVEADEYRRHFLELTPAHILITSIDFDHPDAFSSIEDTEHAYTEFIARLQSSGTVITPQHVQEQHPGVAWPTDTMAIKEDAARDISVPLPGNHMQMNAALACEAAVLLGINRDAARTSLLTFPGLSRRFELLGTYEGIEVRSDYGHHPTEITATIAGSRIARPDAHIIAIFEAHMPLRLHTFFNEFADALSTADSVIIVPPFVPAGRGNSDAMRDTLRLRDTLIARKKQVTYAAELPELSSALQEHLKTSTKPVLAIGFSAGSLDEELRKTVNKR